MKITRTRSRKKNKPKRAAILRVLAAFIVRATGAVAMLALSAVSARMLGAQQSGIFFLALSIISILATLTRVGLDNVVVRRVAASATVGANECVNHIVSYSAIVVFSVSLATSGLLFLTADVFAKEVFSKPELSIVLLVMSLALMPQAIACVFGCALQGGGSTSAAVLINNCSIPILCTTLFFLKRPETAVDATQLYVMATLVVGPLAVWYWKRGSARSFVWPEIRPDGVEGHVLVSMLSIQAMTMLTQWSGQLFVGVWHDSTEVAVYAAAQRASMITSAVLIALNTVFAPRFAAMYSSGKIDALRSMIKQISRVLFVVGGLVGVVGWNGADQIMSLFGDDFVTGVMVFKILLVGQFVNCITGSVGVLLQMTGHESHHKNNMALGSIILLAVAPIVVPYWGPEGMAVITSAALSITNLMSVWAVRKKLNINTLNII